MAEAGDKDTPPGWRWVLYSEYLEDKLDEVLVLEQADRLGRKEIRERRLRCRYRDRDNNLGHDYWVDRDGTLHYDSLIDQFWREAILDRETSSMVWLVPARFYNHVEPTYEVLGIESERDVRIFDSKYWSLRLSRLRLRPNRQSRLSPRQHQPVTCSTPADALARGF